MPGMDGFQVMESLKEIEEDGYLPILVITAQPDHKLRALQAGAKDFVSKPFDLAELRARVHNILEVRLLHRAMKSCNKALEATVSALEAKLNSLTQEVGAKANMTDVLKWNDRVALRNEDMRLFPRCLDNPGPNSPNNLTDVFANSCAKVPAQTWMLSKPYH